jgi:hypothetical protein
MSIESERIRQILKDKINRIHYPRNRFSNRQVIVFYPKPGEYLSEKEIEELEAFIQGKTGVAPENIINVPVDGCNHIGITIREITSKQISELKEDIPEFDSK